MKEDVDPRVYEILDHAGAISTLLEKAHTATAEVSTEPELDKRILDQLIDANRVTLRLVRDYLAENGALDYALRGRV